MEEEKKSTTKGAGGIYLAWAVMRRTAQEVMKVIIIGGDSTRHEMR